MSDSSRMSNIEDEWLFVHVLPNLSIRQAIGNEYVAIVPPNDPRIESLIQKHPNLQYFISRFADQFRRPVIPSVLIVRNGIPRTVLESDALISFRNIFAICYVVATWQDFLNRGWWLGATGYSDYFAIYPISPDKDYKCFITISPAMNGLDMPNEFSGQTAPELNGQVHDPQYDHLMFDTLMLEWEKRYIKGKLTNWRTTILFRSLQLAYQASAIPMSNKSTIYDYGSSLALWVSAFEVLVHPKSEQSGLSKVLGLLEQGPLHSRQLCSKSYSITRDSKGNKQRVTLPQKLYHQIYKARNDFLHGNPVTVKHLYPWNKTKRNPLNHFAPLLYKLALISFLHIYYYNGNIADLPFEQYRSIRGLEEGLAKSTVDKNEKE